ncbi:MAG TPA: PAS domain-containing sensor histidine kinase, partial [Aliidongia sp.]|nr:PAS domain-containing sensor histidine kinase [Aliidongia sp.]
MIWLHVASDALIGIAYYSIPLALLTSQRQRRDTGVGWMVWLFASFVVASGTSHFLSIVALWQPFYWVEGGVKAVAALLSVGMATLLWIL